MATADADAALGFLDLKRNMIKIKFYLKETLNVSIFSSLASSSSFLLKEEVGKLYNLVLNKKILTYIEGTLSVEMQH